MTFSGKKYFAAGIAAHFNGLVLLGRRSKNCHNLAGHWSIPCGMIELSETPKQAAYREFFEETGCQIKGEVKLLDEFEVQENNFFALFSTELKDLIFPSSRAIDAIEHDEWGFFKIGSNTLPTPMTKETRAALLKLE